ncbi:hypothetical protein [Sphingomonas sp. ID0503]|uniref:hypothetical protein n=1 Tax=Sphingomonas sp. ID0503 TaxID=3399691 RepID=UPI003AFB4960
MPRILQFLGDSHLNAIEHAIEAGLFVPYQCRSKKVPGATAVGLRHPTSKTQALPYFRGRLAKVDPAIVPIFQLGEVDCGFVIWVRAQRHGESVEAQLTASLDAYVAFLVEVRAMGYRDVIVTSAILPTIRDGELDGEVAHLRREVEADHRTRTNLTLRYNAELALRVRDAGCHFVDLTPDLIDPATGLISERFRHFDIRDHHLDPLTAGPVWARRLLPVIDGLPPLP